MATGARCWSTTAATNATADSTINWAEGQAPSSVNDSARALMASWAKWREDQNGTIVRLIETDGKPTTTMLTMPQLTIGKAWQTNLVEENQAELSCTQNSVAVSIKAFGIATVRIQTAGR